MLGIALCSRFPVAGTALGALFGNGPLEQFPVIEASLAFMLPALFLSFLLAAFRRPQSLTIAAALAGALLGVVLFSIPVAILAGIGAGCVAALFQPALRRPTMNTDVLVIGSWWAAPITCSVICRCGWRRRAPSRPQAR